MYIYQKTQQIKVQKYTNRFTTHKNAHIQKYKINAHNTQIHKKNYNTEKCTYSNTNKMHKIQKYRKRLKIHKNAHIHKYTKHAQIQ